MDSIDKINILLATKGLSGADLMRTIGLSHGVYSQWNTKITKPSNKNLAKVANALGVSIGEILSDSISSDAKKESQSEDEANMDSIDKINHILVDRKMSGAELSRQIGVSSGVFSQWNTKRTKPSLRNISKIAAVLDVPAGALMPDSETEATKKSAPSKDKADDETIARINAELEDMSKDALLKVLDMIKVIKK